MENHPPKGLVYALSVYGIGHVIRAYWISKALSEKYHIDFVEGGVPIPFDIETDRMSLVSLPRMIQNQIGTKFEDPYDYPEGISSYEKLIEVITESFKNQIRDSYDFFLLESYPFIKTSGKPENDLFIQHVKRFNPNCKIICSLDPSFHLKQMQLGQPDLFNSLLDVLENQIDYIFFNSDPRVERISSFYSHHPIIRKKIHYAGYICDPDTPTTSSKNKRKRIIIYLGKHRDKIESYQTLALVAKYFPDYEFHAYESPNFLKTIDDSCRNKIQMPKNFFFKRFSEEWGKSISECKLLITTGKSAINTAIRTKTPTLVVYLPDFPQLERYKAFDHTGLINLLSDDDFTKNKLEKKIKTALTQTLPDELNIDMNGAENTLKLIQKLC